MNDPSATAISCQSTSVGLSRWRNVIGAFSVGVALMSVPCVLGVALAAKFGLLAALAISVGVALALGAPAWRMQQLTREMKGGTVGFREDAVVLVHAGTTRVIPRRRLAAAYAGVSNALILELASGERIRAVLEGANAEELVRRLAIAPRVATLPLRPIVSAPVVGFSAFGVALAILFMIALPFVLQLHIAWPLLVALGASFVIGSLVGLRYANPRVVVGVDGVRVILSGRRFIPYEKIGFVSSDPSGSIYLQLTSGRTLSLPTIAQSREQITQLLQVIQRGIAERAPPAEKDAGLERQGRSTSAWRDELARAGAGGFRQAALPPARLVAIAEDGASELEQRVAAVLALRVADPTSLARVRVVAESSADARAQEALLAAAADEVDEARIERALARRS